MELDKNIYNHFNNEEQKYIDKVIEKLSPIYDNSTLYCEKFAIRIVRNIIENRLDFDSAIVGLLFPAFMISPNIINDNLFSDEIKNIFSRLEKIENLNLSTRKEQLENIKNMFIALAKDIRVIIIKLCIEEAKLHFLDKFEDNELAEFMQIITDIYFPVAQMIGLNIIKNSFGNATFKYYKPHMYEELTNSLSLYIEERNDNIKQVIKSLKNEVSSICPNAVIYGRQKQLYSIAKKLQQKNMAVSTINDIYGRNNYLHSIADKGSLKDNRLNQIMDILAVRIIVDTVEQCYATLGKVFTIFKPLGNFKDYIATPKENGYQSLHSAIVLENGDPVEIQIRTFDMHTYAEYGLAAHWAYKEKKKVDNSGVKINYIRSIMDISKEKSNEELLQILKTDVYSGKIFVQSPMGKILEFPEGSTPIDFAYAIHSNVGNTCVGSKINGRMMPLTTTLNNGDIVEIITNPNAKGPSRDWLKVVKSSSARSKINAFFKKEMKEENIKKGKVILENSAKSKNLNLSRLLVNEYLEEVFEKYSFTNIDDMYASIGYGGITAIQILNKLQSLYKTNNNIQQYEYDTQLSDIRNDGEIVVKGYANLMTKLAKCCNPLPGDEIVGYISRGSGITIHRKDCDTLKTCEFERLIECNWSNNTNKTFVGAITIIAQDTPGLIAKITKKLNDDNVSLVGIMARSNGDDTVSINIQASIKNKSELDTLINKLNNFSFVLEIHRTA